VLHTFDTTMNLLGIPAKLFSGPVVLSSQRCYEDTIWPPYRKPARLAHMFADAVVVNCEAVKAASAPRLRGAGAQNPCLL